MRPGFGTRHPMVAALISAEKPAGRQRITWQNGRLPLQVSAYTSVGREFPMELLISVRCLVRVDDQIVLCETRDGERHIVPGGHREAGETFTETAVREVHEETGWLIRPETVRTLGWLHLQNLNAGPSEPHLPYPDFLQLVVCGSATERDGGRDADWTDIEGFETSSRLVSVGEARTATMNDLFDLIYLDRMLAGP